MAQTNPLDLIRAAAVCVRGTPGDDLRFLLVRTKEPPGSPERWTFPKGHVEKGESLFQAAEREAREEAGVTGTSRPDPLPPYLFPVADSTRAVVVVPFLLRIGPTVVISPTEPGRDIAWLGPTDAKDRLQQNREPRFEHEHDRVIDGAIAILSGMV
jgi:8-oxo-dGTP pyrophosphatase MutT (NUDIX family)